MTLRGNRTNTAIPASESKGMSRARGSSPGNYGGCFIVVMEPDKAPARGDVLYGLDRLADAISTQPVQAGRLSVVRPRDSCPRGTAPTGSPECTKSRLFAAARCVKPRPLGTPPLLPNPTRRPPALEGTGCSMARAGEGADKFALTPKLKPRPSAAPSRGLHQDEPL